MPRALIVLTESFADWECALLMAAGREYLGLEIETAAPAARPVRSIGGLLVTPDAGLDVAVPGRFDAIVLAGGLVWGTEAAPDLTGPLRAFAAAGRVIGGICGATLALAEAGLLDDRDHTSNSLEFLGMATAYGGAARYRDAPYAVSDRGVITAPGTAPTTFAVAVIAALGLDTPDFATEIRQFAAEYAQP